MLLNVCVQQWYKLMKAVAHVDMNCVGRVSWLFLNHGFIFLIVNGTRM